MRQQIERIDHARFSILTCRRSDHHDRHSTWRALLPAARRHPARVPRWSAGCAVRVGQPQVVAEMVAGFLIGPSLVRVAGAASCRPRSFPRRRCARLFVVSQIGLVLYMFCVGLEFRPELMPKHARRAAAVSIAGIVVPFALGGALALVAASAAAGFFADQVQPLQAVLFVGAAMSITAFPMLARIIYERGIAGTALGTLTLAAGAIDDAAAWIILAIVLGSFTGSTTLAISAARRRPRLRGRRARRRAAAAAHGWTRAAEAARRAWRHGCWPRCCRRSRSARGSPTSVGIYAVFGAFILGAAMPRGLLSRELQRSHRAADDGAAGAVVLRLLGAELAARPGRTRPGCGR